MTDDLCQGVVCDDDRACRGDYDVGQVNALAEHLADLCVKRFGFFLFGADAAKLVTDRDEDEYRDVDIDDGDRNTDKELGELGERAEDGIGGEEEYTDNDTYH